MALTIDETVTSCPPGVATTVQAATALRLGGVLQNQSSGSTVRVRLGAAPSATLGVLLGPGESMNYHGGAANAQGNGTNYYVGDVRVWNLGTVNATLLSMDAVTP